jgi:hypothetical protein
MVCGHCHGQRIPRTSTPHRAMMSVGDPYDAGENLHEFYKPVQRDNEGRIVQLRVSLLAGWLATSDRL